MGKLALLFQGTIYNLTKITGKSRILFYMNKIPAPPPLSFSHFLQPSRNDRTIWRWRHCLLGDQKWNYKKLLNITIFIAILHYLEAEIDYMPFILFCRVVFQDYVQEFSSQLD